MVTCSPKVHRNTPPKPTSSPNSTAVGSFLRVRSIALLMACIMFILVVSPENVHNRIINYVCNIIFSLKFFKCLCIYILTIIMNTKQKLVPNKSILAKISFQSLVNLWWLNTLMLHISMNMAANCLILILSTPITSYLPYHTWSIIFMNDLIHQIHISYKQLCRYMMKEHCHKLLQQGKLTFNGFCNVWKVNEMGGKPYCTIVHTFCHFGKKRSIF